MKLSPSSAVVGQTDEADPFQLTPSVTTVTSFEIGIFSDREVDGDYFDVRDLANQLEVHFDRLPSHELNSNEHSSSILST